MPGATLPDLKLRDGHLLPRLRKRPALLLREGDPAPDEAGLDTIALPEAAADALGLEAGDGLLVRPDAHVSARLRPLSAPALRASVDWMLAR